MVRNQKRSQDPLRFFQKRPISKQKKRANDSVISSLINRPKKQSYINLLIMKPFKAGDIEYSTDLIPIGS